ncbi:hypothetical protein BU17DRAFT_7301, partial [Hysterangium stoloniferum]
RLVKQWLTIPQFEERAVCGKCECIESIDHILITCKPHGRELVGQLIERAWAKTGEEWPGVTLGTILGHGLANYNPRRKPDTANNRIFAILVMEAVHLWKIRCEARIGATEGP